MRQETEGDKEVKTPLISNIFDLCWFEGSDDESFDDDDVVTQGELALQNILIFVYNSCR